MKFRHFRSVALVILLTTSLCTFAAQPPNNDRISPTNRSQARAALIPYPQDIQWKNLDFTAENIRLVFAPDLNNCFAVKSLQNILKNEGYKVFSMLSSYAPLSDIELKLSDVKGIDNNPEGYSLNVTKNKITITATDKQGLLYAVQTFRQLIQKDKGKTYIPCCSILDHPAFKIRGLMHDTGRNFQTIPLLKKQMDLLCQYRMNVFHWHLTDNPAYRIESRKYPQLNDPKNCRPTRNPGKFYTFAQINDMIEYCRARNITIIPEIDMPGHSEYFKNTFGFDMQDPRGMKILSDLLEEFFNNVDLHYFHMGSDEVRVKNTDFMPAMEKIIKARGKELIVWRPGHMPAGDVITQLWSRNSAPAGNMRYIDSRANYVNHMDPFTGIIRAFVQQPCSVPESTKTALGGILCYWPDTNIDDENFGLTISPVFPAMVTYSERLWRGSETDREDLWAKLPEKNSKVFDEFRLFENDLITHRDRFFANWPFPYVKQTDIAWKLIGPFDNKGKLDTSFAPETHIQPEYSINGKIYKWHNTPALGATIHLKHFFGFDSYITSANKGTVYALAYLHSDKEQTCPMWIQFGTPSTSARRSGGNPPAGKWSQFDSMIWVNGSPVKPPEWNNPGTTLSRGKLKETAFTNEGYFFRPPTMVKLKKGANKILIKAPFGKVPGYGTGKWMFTCIPVEWDGKRATEKKDVYFSVNSQ